MQSYESLLNGDLNWALPEGSMHFKGKSAVYCTLMRLAHGLDVYAEKTAHFLAGYRGFSEFVTHAEKSLCCLKSFNPLSP